MDITLLHDSFTEYYAAEWLIDQLDTPNWSDTFDEIGAVEQYPVWSESINVMCDLLSTEQHEKIIQRYQDWEKYEYGLNHLVKHTALSKSSERVLGFITPRYVREKLAKFQSPGPAIDDANIAITVAADNGDLVSSFKYAVLKEQIYRPAKRPMLGLESVLRARMGETERAIADVEHFGNQDDRLLVYAEAIVQLWDKASGLTERYLNQVYSMLQDCSPEVIELAALRIAEVIPATALDLAQRIPEPKTLYDELDRVESPNRSRCTFRILRSFAEHDLLEALAYTEKLADPFLYSYANTAIGAAILPKEPTEALELFSAALTNIQDEHKRTLLSCALGRYILWHIPSMDTDHSILAFKGVSQLIPLNAERSGCIDIIDSMIKESPLSWLTAWEQLPVGTLKDMIGWRLIEFGHTPLAEPETFEDQQIRNLVRAEHVTRVAGIRPLEAVNMALDLETSIGYIHAIAGVAEQLEDTAPEVAQSLIDNAFTLKLIQRDWQGFEAALELMNVALRWPGEIRQRILSWCLGAIADLEPSCLRPDARLALGSVLAEAFMRSSPSEVAFFRSLMLEFDAEYPRKMIALYILQNLPEGDCVKFAKSIEEFGFLSGSSSENGLFLPETQVELLICLAERCAELSHQVFFQLLIQATNLLGDIEYEKDKDETLAEIIRCALRLSPRLGWTVYQRCSSDPVHFLRQMEYVLREYIAATNRDMKELFIRLFLDSILAPNNSGVDSEHGRYVASRNLTLLVAPFPPVGITYSKSEIPSDEWLQDFPDVITKCMENFGPSWSYPLNVDLHRLMELIAQLDWATFMKIVRDPALGPECCRYIRTEALREFLLISKTDVMQLFDDFVEIQKVRSSEEENSVIGNSRLSRIIAAATAAYDPDACIDMLAAHYPNVVRYFARDLDFFTPKKAWTEEQLSSLFDLIEAHADNQKDVVEAETSIATWLHRHFRMHCDFAERIAHAATGLSKASSVFEAAKDIRQIDRDTGNVLTQEAFNRAIEECDTDTIYSIVSSIDTAESFPRDMYLRAMEALRGSSAEYGKCSPFEEIINDKERLYSTGSIKILCLLRESKIGTQAILDSIVESAVLRSEKDIEFWMAKISEFLDIDQMHRNYFARLLIKRGIKEGIVRSPQLLQYITDLDDRVDALLALSEGLTVDERDSVLKRACHEAESAVPVQQREVAFRKIAKFYMKHNATLAFNFYERALREMARGEHAIELTLAIADISESCLLMQKELSVELASRVYRLALEFSCKSILLAAPEAKCYLLFWSALALQPFNKAKSTIALREAANEYNQSAQIGESGGELSIAQACCTMSEHLGIEVTREMLSVFLEALPTSMRQNAANGIVRSLCRQDLAEKPFERWDVWHPRLDEAECILVRQLLPLCSPATAALAHLVLAISAWESDRHLAADEISSAASMAEQAVETLDKYVYRDIWISYCIIRGYEGCFRAARALLTRWEDAHGSAVDLSLCMIERIPHKMDFLRDLWSALESLREYA